MRFLNISLKESEVIEISKNNGIELPEFVRNFFLSFNGVNDEDKLIGEISICPIGIPLSLEKALELYKENSTEEYWDKDLFPLFENDMGDYLLVQMRPDSDYRMIYYFSAGNPDLIDGAASYYDSDLQMIKTIIECYQNHAYRIDKGHLDIDFDLNTIISKRLNPNSEYWKIFD